MLSISINFSDSETPTRAGTQLYLSHAPSPPESLQVFRNGLLQEPGGDYVAAGFVIVPSPAPTEEDRFRVFYRF